jgi:hypothetical protein
MLRSRLKRAILDRLSRGARAAGERSLALLITAGVASCGGETAPADASTDQHSDAPPDSTVIIEAPAYDGGANDASDSSVIIEAPIFDAGAG